MKIDFKSYARSLFLALSIGFSMLSIGGASAQTMPTALEQEIMLKTALSALNDANFTGDYSVFRQLCAKPFRDAYSAEKLKDSFKTFADQKIYFGIVVAKQPVATEPVKIDADGVLIFNGYFDTGTTKIKYAVKYAISEDEWKPIGVNVKVGD